MINKLSKLCAAIVALSAAGLVNADTTDNTQLLTYSIVSGAAINIAAQPHVTDSPNVGGHLAAKAAVVVGANTTVNDIYAGAAVTTGDGSHVKQIYAGAAAGVGANALAQDVTAGAAVVVGANGAVGNINAGAAITLGAGATYYPNPAGLTITHGAGSAVSEITQDYTDAGFVDSAEDMSEALSIIKKKITDNPVEPLLVTPFKDLSGLVIGQTSLRTEYYSAINIQANTTLTVIGEDLTVITSEAVTLGAGAAIILEDGATVTWILGGSLNLGAGSTWRGETYVKGAVNGATSDVECGNLYATGPVSIVTMGHTSCRLPATEAPQKTQHNPGSDLFL
jgi:hypothetical protein